MYAIVCRRVQKYPEYARDLQKFIRAVCKDVQWCTEIKYVERTRSLRAPRSLRPSTAVLTEEREGRDTSELCLETTHSCCLTAVMNTYQPQGGED